VNHIKQKYFHSRMSLMH